MPDDEKRTFSDPFYKLVESSEAQFYWCFPKKEITEIGKFLEYALSLRRFSSVKNDPEVVTKMFLQETDVNRHAIENRELREKTARYDQEQKVLQSDMYKEFRPSIIERTLVFTHSDTGERRQVVHLHYKHWPDRAPAPDLDGLLMMLKRHAEYYRHRKSHPCSYIVKEALEGQIFMQCFPGLCEKLMCRLKRE